MLRRTAMVLVGLAVCPNGPVAAGRAGGLRVVGSRPSTGSGTSVERQAYLMGTRVRLVTCSADREAGLQILERMLRGLEAVEAELSTWREDSLLSAINRQPVGATQAAPEPLCDVLGKVSTWRDATRGAFDPAIGSLIAAWGLREGGRLPSSAELARARGNAGLQHLEVRSDPCRVTRRRAVILDAGAFGKGAAIDRVAGTVLVHHAGGWMIDLGGQVAVGAGSGEPWTVALAHPRQRDEAALQLRLELGSLATSGGAARDLEVEGRKVGHILDPRTGRPVSRRESVTVWHPSALVADILSTALYVMGIDDGLAWAEARQIAACFLVPDPSGPGVAVRATRPFQRRFF